jgi:deoxycytidine triphosphate deaminase
MEKKYVGNSKNIQGKFGEIQKISFSKKDLELLLDNLNEKGYVNLNRIAKKETDKYGNTHYMVIDEWKPEEKQYSAPVERKTAGDTIARKVEETALNSSNEEFELPF